MKVKQPATYWHLSADALNYPELDYYNLLYLGMPTKASADLKYSSQCAYQEISALLCYTTAALGARMFSSAIHDAGYNNTLYARWVTNHLSHIASVYPVQYFREKVAVPTPIMRSNLKMVVLLVIGFIYFFAFYCHWAPPRVDFPPQINGHRNLLTKSS